MARVHLFTSHHSAPGDHKNNQPDKAFAALSAQEQSTIAHTHKEASDEPHTLDVTAVASPSTADEQGDEKSSSKESIKLSQLPTSSAALTAALLQDASSMDVVGSLAAALSGKQGILMFCIFVHRAHSPHMYGTGWEGLADDCLFLYRPSDNRVLKQLFRGTKGR